MEDRPPKMSAGPARVRLQQARRYLGLAWASLDPRRRPPAPRRAQLSYAEQELLARNQEFIEAAEGQWRAIASEPSGREHVLNKPFSTVRDTAAILYRLGLVLDVLELGVGHTVLDFGAGSCWLSVFLNRLRCHTVSVDVSRTALALGEEAFRADPRVSRKLQSRFVVFDGARLPLESESVDRAVCFDSFHHVPNQDLVLRELWRVLRPGGRLVLAEPGEGHAASEHSRFDSSHFGVLENDLDLADLLARARLAGFTRSVGKPYPDAPAITLGGEECVRLMSGDHSLYPLDELERSLRSFYLVALLKGEPRIDSRCPRALRARIEAPPGARIVGRSGDAVRFPITLTNLGDTVWLSALDEAGGYVSVGGHLLDAEGHLVTRCYFASPLPRDVAPGETVAFEAVVHLPERVGHHVLRVDLVDEKVAWFEQCGSETRDVPLEVSGWPDSSRPHRLGAAIERLSELPPVLPAGGALVVRLRLTNTGDTRWLHGAPGEPGIVCLGAQLRERDGALVQRDHFRVPLPRSVDPGDAVELEACVPVPVREGGLQMAFDLVAEGVCWFEHHGSPVAVIDIQFG